MRNGLFKGVNRLKGEKDYLLERVHTLCEPAGDLVIPLSQPTVAAGDPVLVGTKLAEGVFSPCSGTVKAVEKRPTAAGNRDCVVLENDKKFRPAEHVGAEADWQELGRNEILRRLRDYGALGGADKRFPTAARLAELRPETVSRVVVDGSEWEPLVSSEEDTLRTFGYGVVTGLRILLRLFPGAEGVILLGEEKTNAAETVGRFLEGSSGIKLIAVPAGRPIGGEKTIECALSDSDGEGACIVRTPTQANAVYEAVCRSRPFVRRVVTVAGSAVKNPGNYLVRIGTGCAELIAAAGGLREGVTVRRAVLGGPLTGAALMTLDVPVERDSSALLLFAEEGGGEPVSECFRCGCCAEICPVGLLPMQMLRAARESEFRKFDDALHGTGCLYCGACDWVCPARQPLTQTFRYAETALRSLGPK